MTRSDAVTDLKKKFGRTASLALIAGCLPFAAPQAAPRDFAAAVDLPPSPSDACIALADIGKTWFVDSRSVLLKVRAEDSTRYRVLEFKERLPVGLHDSKFRFVRHDAADTDQPTHVCINDRVSSLETADNSSPIAEIVDVDVRQAARLVQRAERLAARRRDNWNTLNGMRDHYTPPGPPIDTQPPVFPARN
jgi:hypothetical protein